MPDFSDGYRAYPRSKKTPGRIGDSHNSNMVALDYPSWSLEHSPVWSGSNTSGREAHWTVPGAELAGPWLCYAVVRGIYAFISNTMSSINIVCLLYR